MNWLSNRRIGTKFVLLICIVVLGLAVAGFAASRLAQLALLDDRTDALKSVVEIANSTADALDKQVQAGKLTKEQGIEALRERLTTMKFDKGDGYVFVYTMDGIVVYLPDPKLIGTNRIDFKMANGRMIIREMIDGAVKHGGAFTLSYGYPKPGQTAESEKLVYVLNYKPWNLLLGTGVYLDNMKAELSAIAWSLLAAFAGLGLIVAALAALIAANIVRPLVKLNGQMRRLAAGDLDIAIGDVARKDEVGEMADALMIFKEQAIEKSRLLGLQEATRQQAIDARKRTMQDMASVVENETTTAVNAVGDTAGNVRAAAEEMSQFASAVSIDTQSVASASEQALASAQTVSSAAGELNASIQQIKTQVSHTADVARQAVASGDIATTTVRSLTDAIVRISDVTKLIGDIASQTNLLALNATIEAARAGEAGRGFAVVASEVKNLAAQTARSTEDINRQVAEIQLVSGSAVGAMADVGVRIGEINQSTAAILTAIQQQSDATEEITRNVGETALSAREVSARIQHVSAGAAKVGSQAESVRHSIGEITENIAGLRAALVRVVRTSSEDTNRRKFPRYKMAVRAEILDVSNKRLTAELVDISEGGAKLSVLSGMRTGENGQLCLDGLPLPLPFIVRAREGDALHVAFELTEAQRMTYLQWFNQRLAGKQALAS